MIADDRALSPPAVYPDPLARYKIAALLIGPALALHFVPARLFCRGITFGFGVVFWGHEYLHRALREFVRLVPDWRKYVDPRKCVLSANFTDLQLYPLWRTYRCSAYAPPLACLRG